MEDLMITLSLFDAAAFFQWFVDNASYLFVFLFMVIESSFLSRSRLKSLFLRQPIWL